MHVVVVGETIETLIAVDFMARSGIEVTLIGVTSHDGASAPPLLVGPRLQQWLQTHCPDAGRAVLENALPFTVNSGRDIWWYAEGRWQPHFRSLLNLCVVEAAACLPVLADCVAAHPNVHRLTATSVRLWRAAPTAPVQGVCVSTNAGDEPSPLAADAVWDGGHITHEVRVVAGWWHHQAYYLPRTTPLPWRVLLSFPEARTGCGVVVLPGDDRRHVIVMGGQDTPPPTNAVELAQMVTTRYGGQEVLGDRVPLGEGKTLPFEAYPQTANGGFIEASDQKGLWVGQPLSGLLPRIERLYKHLSLPFAFTSHTTPSTTAIAAWFTQPRPSLPTDSRMVEGFYQQWFDPMLPVENH